MTDSQKLTFSVSTSVKDIPQEDWDRLFGTDGVEGRGYHLTIEESGLNEFKIYYLLAKNGNNLAAAIPFFTTEFSFATIIQGNLQKTILKIQRIINNFLRIRVIFIGLPTAEELYIGIPGQEDLPCILDGALKTINEFAKTKEIEALFFYNLSEKHRFLSGCLKSQGFGLMENFPNTRIKITSGSLEDFISGLGKNTRKELRRKLRESSASALLSTEKRGDVEGIIDDVYKLYLNNFSGSDVHFEKLTPDFFLNISKNMPEETKYFITRDKDKIVAFNLCLVKNKVCIDKFVGFDKQLSRRYHLYYTTFCHNIGWCVKNNIEYYQMGITDYDPKIRLGAKLVPLHVYGKFMNPLLNAIAKIFIRFLSPKNFDPALKRYRARSRKQELNHK